MGNQCPMEPRWITASIKPATATNVAAAMSARRRVGRSASGDSSSQVVQPAAASTAPETLHRQSQRSCCRKNASPGNTLYPTAKSRPSSPRARSAETISAPSQNPVSAASVAGIRRRWRIATAASRAAAMPVYCGAKRESTLGTSTWI